MNLNIYKPTDADRATMARASEEWQAAEKAEAARCQQVLDEVKTMVVESVFQEIKDELADSYTFDYKIATAPVGQEQDDGASWGSTFVNQTTNGGYTGDDFAGTVSIPLGGERFFQFGYSM